ncbi:S-formylglutathione hydrolase [Kozakia baliensis]|uniref:S-formylglutathione hydrolase n=1 Tax=Kozakia baliensis TaxID=153496 RepID=UPI00345B97DE
MSVEKITEQKCCGGHVATYKHRSEVLGLDAKFAVFLPEAALQGAKVPVLYALAGLTCHQETFLTKANAVRFAARHGIALLTPDTSPRGAQVPGENDSYDLGTGAGFYLDATQSPWAEHYRMGTYISEELPALTEALLPLDGVRRGITGHSMGGHGALVHALRAPERWKSVSAFAPISNPSVVPWGQKAFSAYLGTDRARWAAWDATELLKAGHKHPSTILIDQGGADEFLARELQPEHFEAAASQVGQALSMRRHAGYDHSYWFIQTIIEDHLAHHAQILKA